MKILILASDVMTALVQNGPKQDRGMEENAVNVSYTFTCLM